MNVLLDTHIWVWWLTPNSPLSATERRALDQHASRANLCLAAISLWEVQVLHSKGRLNLPLALAAWLDYAVNGVALLPLNLPVVKTLDQLPASFHGDPADRLIVATARSNHLPLATHDSNIRRSRLVKLWKP